MGFDYFYGFLGGETNQWYPALYEGITPVEPGKSPEEGYYFNDDLTDHAIKWIRQQKALMPDKPFFAHSAPGATHAPHHALMGMWLAAATSNGPKRSCSPPTRRVMSGTSTAPP
jgi:arylsulfatase A-like enzyme